MPNIFLKHNIESYLYKLNFRGYYKPEKELNLYAFLYFLNKAFSKYDIDRQ